MKEIIIFATIKFINKANKIVDFAILKKNY